MRKNIVAGNWKMNLDYTTGIGVFSEIINMVNDEVMGEQEVIVCPSFVHLSSMVQLSKSNSRISVGAQNCHQEEKEIGRASCRERGLDWDGIRDV